MRAFSRFAAFLEITPLAAALSTAEEAELSISAVAVLEAVAASNFLIAVLVAEGLVLNDADALDSRLNVRQRNSPPQVYSIISRSYYSTSFQKKQGNFTIFFLLREKSDFGIARKASVQIRGKRNGGKMTMEKGKNRQNLIPYALQAVARPGSRESRARRPPDGLHIRHERGEQGAE